MTINKSTTGKFYVAVQSIGNNETIAFGNTAFQAFKNCLWQLHAEYISIK